MPSMFISLKWKLVVFLSLVLIAITAVWTWQSISKQYESLDIALSNSLVTRNKILSELVTDNALRLSQFAQLITESPAILQASSNSNVGSAKEALEKSWLSYNINLGLDYLAIYDIENSALAEIYSLEFSPDKAFKKELGQALTGQGKQQNPQNFIYCSTICMLVAIEPYIDEQGKQQTIVLAQNMADMVRVYYQLSEAGLGILIDSSRPDKQLAKTRGLADSNAYVWAISDFNNFFPIIKSFYSKNNLSAEVSNLLYAYDDSYYLVQPLSYPNIKFLGEQSYFISIADETSAYQIMRNNIQRGATIGFLGLFFAEAALLFFLISPLNKLSNISNALHLLPHQEFAKAAKRVKSKRSIFPDELSSLESSTAYVAEELHKLHVEISEKNTSLEEQIQALIRSRSFLTRLFDNAQIFILTQDMKFNILSTNKKFDALYDKLPSQFSQLFSSDQDSDDYNQQMSLLSTGSNTVSQQEIKLFDKASNELVIFWTHTVVEDESGEEIILSIGMDQTLQKRAEHDLRWMANHDSLTGVGNRRFFNSAFNKMLESQARGALVFIDVNRFKQINDIYGHTAGDDVLINISQKLRATLRSSDVISRFAGDEFIAILSSASNHSLPKLLDKLTRELSDSIILPNGRTINYTVSVGATLFPDHGMEAQTLINHADMAMYNAKKKGMGFWHIFDANDEQVVQLKNDNTIILSIKHALKNNSFKLVYQPIANIHTGEISHYEVLLRMFDEQDKPISPGLFIPVAERSGEIRSIDIWVLDNALRRLRELRISRPNLRFAINISAPTMQADDFPQLIMDSIARHELEPEAVIIELTETAYIENFQQVLRNLRQVTAEGVHIALDDFGVGFSSFTHLKMLPLRYVKLDGSYIKQLVDNKDDQIFVKSLTAIIEAYGMDAIAEFVEDEEVVGRLIELGVTYGQGYHIGKPGEIVG